MDLNFKIFEAAASLGNKLGNNFRRSFILSETQKTDSKELSNEEQEKLDRLLQYFLGNNGQKINILSDKQKQQLLDLIEMRRQEEEDHKKHLEEVAKQMIIMQATSAAALESAYKATAPDEKEDPEAYARHIAEMKEKVEDAVRAEAQSLSTNELRDFADRYPGIKSLVNNREEKLRRLGFSSIEGLDLNAFDLEKLKYERRNEIETKIVEEEKLIDKQSKIKEHLLSQV